MTGTTAFRPDMITPDWRLKIKNPAEKTEPHECAYDSCCDGSPDA